MHYQPYKNAPADITEETSIMSFSHRANFFEERRHEWDKSTRISGEQWSCRSNEEEGRLFNEKSQTRPQKWFRVIHQLQLSYVVNTFLVFQATVKKQNMIKYKRIVKSKLKVFAARPVVFIAPKEDRSLSRAGHRRRSAPPRNPPIEHQVYKQTPRPLLNSH